MPATGVFQAHPVDVSTDDTLDRVGALEGVGSASEEAGLVGVADSYRAELVVHVVRDPPTGIVCMTCCDLLREAAVFDEPWSLLVEGPSDGANVVSALDGNTASPVNDEIEGS